jgi:outer membrane receptor protein involved in Fe transport
VETRLPVKATSGSAMATTADGRNGPTRPHLYLVYQPSENVIAALSVENLLDETYKVYTHEFNSPGITVKGSLRMRFAGGAAPLPEEKPIRR